MDKNNFKVIILVVIILGIVVFAFAGNKKNFVSKEDLADFVNSPLKTNMTKTSIPLDKIIDGGPGKDGIPALNNPKFISIKEAEKNIEDNIDGIVVSVNEETKFYPYNIIVWHEIVNDVVGDKPLVVTFCPLCGSAIVFDTPDQFGVSGKLYESNLLMYDKKTESLWSQSIGTAVVGDRTGEKLNIYPSQALSFKVFKEKWPDGEVLSINTGYSRNYNLYPYGDYDSNEEIFFPVSVKDNRFPVKEIMYVVNAYKHSIAFPIKDLSKNKISVNVNGENVTAVIFDGEVLVKDASGKVLPGYHEMWFSWATQHQGDGLVWKK